MKIPSIKQTAAISLIMGFALAFSADIGLVTGMDRATIILIVMATFAGVVLWKNRRWFDKG